MDMKGKLCLDCGVELVAKSVSVFASKVGYYCSECRHIYSLSEYERLFKDYSRVYDEKQDRINSLIDDDDPSKLDIIKISSETVNTATTSQPIMNPELQKLLEQKPVNNIHMASFERQVDEID